MDYRPESIRGDAVVATPTPFVMFPSNNLEVRTLSIKHHTQYGNAYIDYAQLLFRRFAIDNLGRASGPYEAEGEEYNASDRQRFNEPETSWRTVYFDYPHRRVNHDWFVDMIVKIYAMDENANYITTYYG